MQSRMNGNAKKMPNKYLNAQHVITAIRGLTIKTMKIKEVG